jgi:plastocyanin
MTETKKLLGGICILLILALCAYTLSRMQPSVSHTTSSGTSTGILLPPPLTAEVKAQLAASKGFQVLVSYTNRGFEPSTATIKKGDTIRFTNNSGGDLWVASAGTSGGKVYPAGSGNECGQSAFDSCRAIKEGEFWEFTFTTTGTWGYQNNRDRKMTGTVRVK